MVNIIASRGHSYKVLITGERARIEPMLFTTAILVGGTDNYLNYYRTRFCYETEDEAKIALENWDGTGDPPGNWIVQKPENRYNPAIMLDQK